MDRVFVMAAAVAGFLGVALGAFGAHGLRGKLDPDLFRVYETGVLYHLIHAIALLGAAWVAQRYPNAVSATAGWLFAGGIVIFSGSLYVLAMSGMKIFGAITPIGGLAFLGGWVALFFAVWR